MDKFEFFNKGYCYDPRNVHKKRSIYRLKTIDLDMTKKAKSALNTKKKTIRIKCSCTKWRDEKIKI